MESLADTIASFNPMGHFNRNLTVAGVALVLPIIALFVLKCVFGLFTKDCKTNRKKAVYTILLLYTSPSPRDVEESRMTSSA